MDDARQRPPSTRPDRSPRLSLLHNPRGIPRKKKKRVVSFGPIRRHSLNFSKPGLYYDHPKNNKRLWSIRVDTPVSSKSSSPHGWPMYHIILLRPREKHKFVESKYLIVRRRGAGGEGAVCTDDGIPVTVIAPWLPGTPRKPNRSYIVHLTRIRASFRGEGGAQSNATWMATAGALQTIFFPPFFVTQAPPWWHQE